MYKKAFTMLELLVVTIIIASVIALGYYFMKDFRLSIDFNPFVWFDNVKIELCENLDGKIINNDSCHWFKVTQLNFGNTWFTYNQFENSWIGIGDKNEESSPTNKIDLTKYESSNSEYKTVPKSLYSLFKALSWYNAEHWCDTNETRNVIYKINWMYFTCNFDKIQYLKDSNLWIRIIDWFLYVK